MQGGNILSNINFTNSVMFEFFVKSVLRQLASNNNKKITFNNQLPEYLIPVPPNKPCYFNAFSPNGFDKYNGIVLFDFKFFKDKSSANSLTKYIDNLIKRVKRLNLSQKATMILIINLPFDINNPTFYKDKNLVLDVWGKDKISLWTEQYPIDYSNTIALFNNEQSKNSKIATNITSITSNDFDKKSNNNLEAVKHIIRNGNNFAIVLGAGISIDPGAKSWKELLNYFVSELSNKGIIDDSKTLSGKIGGSSLTTAQLCKELYNSEADYFWEIHNGLYRNKKEINENFAIYSIAKIASMCKKMPHFRILTYNYDNYLESYLTHFKVPYNSLYDSECDINNDLSIYHVHGFLPEVNCKSNIESKYKKSIYLTEENYNNLYNDPYSWQISSQLSFFRENICLFVGCSLTDPNIRRLLEMTKKENRIHYAILTKGNMSIKDLSITSNHFSRLGIEIIWANNYKEISSKLQQLY